MRLVSRSGLIVTAVTIGAFVAPTAQAGGLAGGVAYAPGGSPGAAQQEAQGFLRISRDPASARSVVRANPDEQVSASTPSGPTVGPVTSSRDGATEPRLRAAFALAQTHRRSIAPTTTAAVSTGSHLICTPRSEPGFCRSISNRPANTAAHSLGFQYDDAAIGAGVMAALLLLAGTATLTLRRRGQLRLR